MVDSVARLVPVGAPKSAKTSGSRVYSDAFRRDVLEKLKAGMSASQLERSLGVSRRTIRQWKSEAEPPPLSLMDAVRSGDRRAYLVAWRDELAKKITEGVAARDLAPLGKQLGDTIAQLDELDSLEREDADVASAPDEDLTDDDI